MIKIENLTKVYKGGKKAVSNLSLDIEDGDIFGFIGQNGAGKSTTIKSIVGILDFNEGSITINGKNIKTQPVECKKEIAYIPDNPDLYEYLTGIEYINFICDLYQVSSEDRTAKIKEYSTRLELVSPLGDVISSYSHGMKQKLAIIAALSHSPKVLVMDEPFVGLDPKATHEMKLIMKEFTAAGACIFFSTHVLEVAQTLCNKIAIIKDGVLLKHGITEEVIGDNSLEKTFLELVD